MEVNIPVESEVDLKLQNIMMLLRKCCNHPYLIEYPIDPVTQEFKVKYYLIMPCFDFCAFKMLGQSVIFHIGRIRNIIV